MEILDMEENGKIGNSYLRFILEICVFGGKANIHKDKFYNVMTGMDD